MTDSTILQQIENWKEALSDSTQKNPLLKWQQGKGKPYLQIDVPASKFYEVLLRSDKPEFQLDELKTKKPEDEKTKIFAELFKVARRVLQEKGVNTLFAVIGVIRWTTKTAPRDRDFAIAPLLLVPVELVKVRRRIELLQATDDSVLVNPLIAAKLDELFRVRFPKSELIEDWSYQQFVNAIKSELEPHPNVRFEEAAYVALFEDPKAAMIRDLEEHPDRIANHPILRALAGDFTAYANDFSNSVDPKTLDEIRPNRVLQIRDADSSQQVVIESAKLGRSFIVKGPPGTGKSQTITNIVTELVGMRKRVLLVSEKQTALEVVAKRLEESGLGDLCLKLYDKSTKKKAFLEELKRTETQLQQVDPAKLLDAFFQELSDDRYQLTTHAQQLHQIQPVLNKSVFELFGELLKFKREGVPPIEFHVLDVGAWSEQKLIDARRLLTQLGGFSEIFLGAKTTIWSELDIEAWSAETSNSLRNDLAEVRQATREIDDIVSATQRLLSVEVSGSLRNLISIQKTLSHLSEAPPAVADWEITREISEFREAIDHFEKDYSKLEQASLWRIYDRQILRSHPSLRELLERFRTYQGWQKFFHAPYRRDRRSITKYRRNGCWVLDRTLLKDLEKLAELQQIQARLEQPDYLARVLLGRSYHPANPDFEQLQEELDWLAKLRQKSSVPITKVKSLLRSPAYRQQVLNLIDRIQNIVPRLENGFAFIRAHLLFDSITPAYRELEEQSVQELRSLLEQAQSDLDNLQSVIDCRNTEQQLIEIGLQDFLSSLKSHKLSASLWDYILRQGIYQSWLRYLLDRNPALRMFRSETHERQIQNFCQTDQRQFDYARDRLRQLHAEQWRNWSGDPNSTIRQQIQFFNAESGKSRGHIRSFITKAADLVTTLKPCWFMTPSTVSQLLDPASVQFDTVIFDEASQIQSADAVPTIMRAKQVIVVGDREQLPPTKSQFIGTLAEDDDEDDSAYSSLLDACGFMDTFSLKWHYRSQSEGLIAFSEKNFYAADGLIYFPSCSQDQHRGVYFHFVENGVFDQKQGNPAEAKAIARLVEQELPHLQQQDRTLGIITFGQPQEQAIRREIEALSKINPDLDRFCQEESNKFFVKPLEHVQGNEADVIFISFGYGRNLEGELSRSFGLLNRQDTGRRRLNVAITRARYKLILVASIRSTDLIQTGIPNAELEIIRRYFAYAESNGQNLEQQNYETFRSLSLLEEDVYDALTSRGYVVEQQIGRSKFPISLAVKAKPDSDRFLLGIECDGVNYSQYDTARDRDRLRRKVLADLGWELHHIWSCDWYRDRDKQISQLVTRIENLLRQHKST